ncbi:MAG: hypothetical protein KDM91_15435 [Verrucomicrobiae bacterium]|nr:hypothetical protein [Verrucomicrobiae bacterium]
MKTVGFNCVSRSDTREKLARWLSSVCKLDPNQVIYRFFDGRATLEILDDDWGRFEEVMKSGNIPEDLLFLGAHTEDADGFPVRLNTPKQSEAAVRVITQSRGEARGRDVCLNALPSELGESYRRSLR